jgi:hypothetical protein
MVWITRGGVTRSLGAALVVLGTAGVARAVPGHPAPASVSGRTATAAQDSGRRRFEHVLHEELPCRGCHGSGATHRVTLVRAPEDCSGCHHDPGRAYACARCHSVTALATPREVRLSLTLKVGGVRARQVRFPHAPHISDSTSIGCRDCHATPVTLARNRDCASCHESHHTGEAVCSGCHARPPQDAHGTAVHLGCAGSQCHEPAKAPLPTQGREVCLFCHGEQREHEPDGTCALCHRIPGAQSRAPGQRGHP